MPNSISPLANDKEISSIENLLLPEDSHFDSEAREFIRCWESKEVNACPGSGKTTILLAKLKVLAKYLPFEDNSGICVLSHTNVAVDEIKARLPEEAETIINAPNFVGTIQSFVDRFIVLPYLRSHYNRSFQIVDEITYGQHLAKIICNNPYQTLRSYLKHQIHENESCAEFLSKLFLTKEGLFARGRSDRLAGPTSQSYKQFKSTQNEAFSSKSVISYSQSYDLAIKIIHNNPILQKLLCKRFRYVFVDEYQDCNKIQRSIISKAFPQDQCVIFKIGDVDQSIFNGFEESDTWKIENNPLSLSSSNRFGQEIADILTNLRTDRQPIKSSKGYTGIKPILIIFDQQHPQNVINTFLSVLDENHIFDTRGTYKVIGKIRNGTGLKLGDYWKSHSNKTKESSEHRSIIASIHSHSEKGELYLAEKTVREFICHLLSFAKIRPSNNNRSPTNLLSKQPLTPDNISKAIDQYNLRKDYAAMVIAICQRDLPFQNIEELIKNFTLSICRVCNVDCEFSQTERASKSPASSKDNNIYIDTRNRRISFNTIHGVKGETHDATLYVETWEHNGSDLNRVLPLFEGKNIKDSPLYTSARHCAYVGMSRPRLLLCVAITSDTYQRHRKAFENWSLIDISSHGDFFSFT